jgi:hypothetical protein
MENELDRYKFVHIPKTSGKYFVQRFNMEYANDYMHPCYNKKYASPINNWLTYFEPEDRMVTMIRNPFDWLYSYYSHNRFHGWDGCNWRHDFKSFEEFINSYCDDNFEWHQPCIHRSFITPVCNDDGHIVCEYIFYYETFYGDITLTEYRDKYNPYMIDIVNNKFQKENSLFLYDFESRIKTERKFFKVEKNKKYFEI